MKTANIWTEKKIHIAKDGSGSRPLCGASANGQPETKVAHGSIPPAITCERCMKAFRKSR